jgi:hypothetical protein
VRSEAKDGPAPPRTEMPLQTEEARPVIQEPAQSAETPGRRVRAPQSTARPPLARPIYASAPEHREAAAPREAHICEHPEHREAAAPREAYICERPDHRETAAPREARICERPRSPRGRRSSRGPYICERPRSPRGRRSSRGQHMRAPQITARPPLLARPIYASAPAPQITARPPLLARPTYASAPDHREAAAHRDGAWRALQRGQGP